MMNGGMPASKANQPQANVHPDIEDTKIAPDALPAPSGIASNPHEAAIAQEPDVMVEVDTDATTPGLTESEAPDDLVKPGTPPRTEEQPTVTSLEHVVAMLENTSLPLLKHHLVADAARTPADELEKEKAFETGGYEDDTEDIPDIPDAD